MSDTHVFLKGNKPDFEPPTDSENSKSVGDSGGHAVETCVYAPSVSFRCNR